MKKNRIYLALCASVLLGGFLASCNGNDEPKHNDSGSKLELPDDRLFILNEGAYNANNSNITLYGPKNNIIIEDIFYKQNSMRLGDNGQDIIAADDKIYISVNGSNYLTKLNAAGVEEKRVSFTSDPELQGGVRYLAEKDGYIYASFYGGVLAKINKKDLMIEKKITKLGANLEGVAIENGKLYVANSYSQSIDPETGVNVFNYLNEMFVIDLRDFTLSKTLTVATNPNQVAEEEDKIFLIAWGNYGNKGYEFQMIDPKQDNKVTSLGVATKMGVGNDKVYLVNSVTEWTSYTTTNTFFYYDIKANKMVESSFMKDAPAELSTSSISMISVDDENGDIYVGTSSYVANGEVYRFKKDGTFVTKFDSQGINPRKAVFLEAN